MRVLNCGGDRYLQRRAEDPVGVVGLDVAGDEGSFPLAGPGDPMAAGVREAGLLSVPLTLHAGEWPERQAGPLETSESQRLLRP